MKKNLNLSGFLTGRNEWTLNYQQKVLKFASLIVRCGNKKEWKSPLKTFGRNEWTRRLEAKII